MRIVEQECLLKGMALDISEADRLVGIDISGFPLLAGAEVLLLSSRPDGGTTGYRCRIFEETQIPPVFFPGITSIPILVEDCFNSKGSREPFSVSAEELMFQPPHSYEVAPC